METDEQILNIYKNKHQQERAQSYTPLSQTWIKEGFLPEQAFQSIKGPFIEIAGPTPHGYKIIDISRLGKKILTSNIGPGLPLWHPQTGKFLGYLESVDFVADATQLPFRKDGIGALFVSYVNIPGLFQEAARALEPNGLLVMQGADKNDFKKAELYGFEPTMTGVDKHATGEETMSVIFQKIEKPPHLSFVKKSARKILEFMARKPRQTPADLIRHR